MLLLNCQQCSRQLLFCVTCLRQQNLRAFSTRERRVAAHRLRHRGSLIGKSPYNFAITWKVLHMKEGDITRTALLCKESCIQTYYMRGGSGRCPLCLETQAKWRVVFTVCNCSTWALSNAVASIIAVGFLVRTEPFSSIRACAHRTVFYAVPRPSWDKTSEKCCALSQNQTTALATTLLSFFAQDGLSFTVFSFVVVQL